MRSPREHARSVCMFVSSAIRPVSTASMFATTTVARASSSAMRWSSSLSPYIRSRESDVRTTLALLLERFEGLYEDATETRAIAATDRADEERDEHEHRDKERDPGEHLWATAHDERRAEE